MILVYVTAFVPTSQILCFQAILTAAYMNPIQAERLTTTAEIPLAIREALQLFIRKSAAHYRRGTIQARVLIEVRSLYVMNPNELCIEMTSTKNTICTDGICPTLTARMGTGGGK